MMFQYCQQPLTQPLTSQVAIEIDDHVGIHVQVRGSRAFSEDGDQLTSGERITFTNRSNRDREIACMEFEKAQLQLFITLCKASTITVEPLYSGCNRKCLSFSSMYLGT